MFVKIDYECEASGLGGVPSSDFRPSDGQIQNEEKEGRRRAEGTEDETRWTGQATARARSQSLRLISPTGEELRSWVILSGGELKWSAEVVRSSKEGFLPSWNCCH